jgi:hypothetical protein
MIFHDIPRWGSLANISGSAGECQFKENFKLPASTSQLRDTTFDHQLYLRRYQHMMIHRCAQRIGRAKRRAQRSQKSAKAGELSASELAADDISNFATELFHQNSTGTVRAKEGDTANNRSDDGLSSSIYCVMMVRNKLDPNSEFHSEIVHCARKVSTRSARFHCPLTELIDTDGRAAGLTNCRGLKSFNAIFEKLHARLGPIVTKNPHLTIPIFTEYRKDAVIYRADPCSQYSSKEAKFFDTTSWCDWALFLSTFERKRVQYPGQIIGFTNFDKITARAYNAHWGPGAADRSGGGQALVEMTQNQLHGFLDPSLPIVESQQLQSNSSMFFWEQKEKVDKVNVIRCTPVTSIHGPVVVFKDFSPEFKHIKDRMKCLSWSRPDLEGAFIFVRPRMYWADMFISAAHTAYNEKREREKTAKRSREKENEPTSRRPKKKS